MTATIMVKAIAVNGKEEKLTGLVLEMAAGMLRAVGVMTLMMAVIKYKVGGIPAAVRVPPVLIIVSTNKKEQESNLYKDT